MAINCESAALEYLRRGWSVIPIRAHDKRPAIRWLEFQQRHASEDEVRDWFQRWPDGNVGIVTGVVSDIVVLDIDPKHDGDVSLAGLIREHSPLPQTIEAQTGGGGQHIYFAHPGGVVRNKVGLAPGMDLRGDGGCVVAPPSVHASGRTYQWLPNHDSQYVSLAPMPHWLLRMASDSQQRPGHTLEYWRKLVQEDVPQGERNNTPASFTGHLLWHGVDPDVVQELLLCWNRLRCRPPLPDEEVIRVIDSIACLHERQPP